ncbi:YqaI family protein [Bacillus thuringiensis]
MIENPMVLHNGYGIRDPQENESILFKDICGSDVFLEDDLLVSPDGEVLLKENVTPYLLSLLGSQERMAGEWDEFTTKD